MRIDELVTLAISRLIGRAVRKIALIVIITYFIVASIYYFGGAMMAALLAEYGIVNAQLIAGGIYVALAAICFIILWATGIKRSTTSSLAASRSRETLILMLVEALILGCELARKRDRGS